MVRIKKEYFLETDGRNGGLQTLNLETTPTVLLVWAANRFNRSASRHYQDTFGISAMDWRMLVMLCKEPGVPVTAASPQVGYDKGAVSRSLARLTELGLARSEVQGTNARNRLWFLTDKGLALHNKILESALARQQKVLKGFTMDDVIALNAMLKKIMQNLEDIDDEG